MLFSTSNTRFDTFLEVILTVWETDSESAFTIRFPIPIWNAGYKMKVELKLNHSWFLQITWKQNISVINQFIPILSFPQDKWMLKMLLIRLILGELWSFQAFWECGKVCSCSSYWESTKVSAAHTENARNTWNVQKLVKFLKVAWFYSELGWPQKFRETKFREIFIS